MISIDQAAANVEALKTPYIRIYDYQNQFIFAIEESDNPATSAEALKNILFSFSGYGKVKVKAATKTEKDGNWTKCAKWDVKVSDTPTATAGNPMQMMQSNPISQVMQTMQMMQAFQTMMQPQQNLQIELMRKEMDYNKQLWEIQKENEDPGKKIAPYLPFIGKVLGIKHTDELSNIANSYKQPVQNPVAWKPQAPQPEPIRTAGVTTDAAPQNLTTDALPIPTLQQLIPLPIEQKMAEMETMLDKIGKEQKVCAEEFIILLYIIYNKPTLVRQALDLYNNGMI